jgi:hypothetical protein
MSGEAAWKWTGLCFPVSSGYTRISALPIVASRGIQVPRYPRQKWSIENQVISRP